MQQLPILHKIKSPSIAIKHYLAQWGIEAVITKNKRGFKIHPELYSIELTGNQVFPDFILHKIRTNFPLLEERIQDKTMVMPLDGFQRFVPEIATLIGGYIGESENTTYTPNPKHGPAPKSEKKADKLHSKVLNKKEIAHEVTLLLAREDFDSMVLTEDQRWLLENYEGLGTQYDSTKGYEHNEAALSQFFTPHYICEYMYELAKYHGYKDGSTILEPSCGTGRVIGVVPDKSLVTAFEVETTAYRIAHKLYPEASIYHNYFETAFMQPERFTKPYNDGKFFKTRKGIPPAPTWLTGYPFNLIIGNPPYGKNSNEYAYHMPIQIANLEYFFLYYASLLLADNGLIVFTTAANFMTGAGAASRNYKEMIFSKLELVDAYRLPDTLFAHGEVPTIVLVMRKKPDIR